MGAAKARVLRLVQSSFDVTTAGPLSCPVFLMPKTVHLAYAAAVVAAKISPSVCLCVAACKHAGCRCRFHRAVRAANVEVLPKDGRCRMHDRDACQCEMISRYCDRNLSGSVFSTDVS